jgi:hypothetical protein
VEVFPLPEMRTQSQSPLAHRGQAALRQKLQWPEHLASHQWGFGRRERLKAKDKAFIASRRRAHPVRRSWAAGRRLPGDLGRYEEAYLIESWLQLMHLRERVTIADRVLEDEIREMLIAPPRIEFLIAAERGDEARHRRAEPAGA